MLNTDLINSLKRFKEIQNLIPEALRATLDMARPISDAMKLIEPIHNNFLKSLDEIRNNPEFNFLRLVENHNFSDDEIIKGLQIVEDNLNPILERLQVKHLWLGANFALNTSAEENPDRIRHFFISIRTLIEYFIETLLAPDEKVKAWEKFAELLDIHLKKNNKDNHSRRGLLAMVADRQSHMKYLEKKSPKAALALQKKLGLKK